MARASPCPEREELELFAAGASTEGTLVEHFTTCAACRELVRRIRDDNQLLSEFVTANASSFRQSEAGGEGSGDADLVPGFRMEGELHRGAQGVVYRAMQLSTRREVALKLLLQGSLATSRQRYRFEREVEVVASLRHPNIVTLYESGQARDGQAFFAMELVHGRPMDRLLRESPLPDERAMLGLFRQLARAIAYAHSRGVIHRDLKPANILVDDDLAPHVLDFGLARTARGGAGADLQARIEATSAGEFLGTFAYAAPEQLRGNPDLIDVRTDVFALGVILYEILAGQRPFSGGNSIADLLLERLEGTPKPPSALKPGIDPDLDLIALTCLKSRPEERYQTAAELADELDRFLDGRPILARRDSVRYVVGKFVRRHKLATSLVASMVLIFVAASMAISVLYGIATFERARAESRLASFRETLQSVNPETGQGAREMSVFEFLDLVEESARKRESQDKAVASNLVNTVDSIRLSFEDRNVTRERLEKSLALAQELAAAAGETDAPEVAEALHNLGRHAILHGELDVAERRYREALAMRERLFGVDAPECGITMQHLASCLRRQHRLDEAAALYERTLRIQERVHGAESEEVAALLNGRAFVLRQRGDVKGALDAFERATAMIERLAGDGDYRVGRGLYNVGQTQRMLHRPADAATNLRRGLDIVLARKGANSSSAIDGRCELVRALLDLGQPSPEAVEQAEEAILALEANGDDPEALGSVRELLAQARLLSGDGAGAAIAWRAAVDHSEPDRRAAIAQRAHEALRANGFEAEALGFSDVGGGSS